MLDKKKIVRRYIDLPKFLSIINTNKLYFARFHELKDPCEGIFPCFYSWQKTLISQKESEINQAIKQDIKETEILLKEFNPNSFQTFLKKIYKKKEFDHTFLIKIIDHLINPEKVPFKLLYDHFVHNLNKKRFVNLNTLIRNTLINCWHSDDVESEGMWQLYSQDNSIAIETTIDKLENLIGYNAFKDNGYFPQINEVTYLPDFDKMYNLIENYTPENEASLLKNYSDETRDAFEQIKETPSMLFFYKRSCYSYENEIRIIITPDIKDNGEIKAKNFKEQFVDIGNINDFIKKIIISPFAPNYYKGIIQDTLKNSSNNNVRMLTNKIADSKIRMLNSKVEQKYKTMLLSE